MLLRLSWRNLWRNRGRSLITAGSVFFAVLLATFMSALQVGTYNRMIDNVAGVHTGHAQVHLAGYWDDPVLDNAFFASDTAEAHIAAMPRGAVPVPRLESFVLASGGERTRGALVVGVDPEREHLLSGLADRVREGAYWGGGDSAGALLGEGLAGRLGLGVGDTVVLLGQGYQGSMAAGAYPVQGIVHFGSPELTERMLYLPLAQAQDLFRAEGLLTGYVLGLDDTRRLQSRLEALRAALGPDYEVMDWAEMMPELKQGLEGDRAGGLIMMGVLYLIIAFGISGTLFMMAHERRREFAVLHAVGLRRALLGRMVLVESVWLGVLGVGAGLLVAWPVVLWFHHHPIRLTGALADAYREFGMEPVMPTDATPAVFFQQGSVVLVVALCVGAFMSWRVYRRDPLDALKE